MALVLSRLQDIRKVGGGFVARCPVHDDRTPSLGVDEGDDGRALVCCRAGCDTAAVLSALKLEAGDLFARTNGNGKREEPLNVYGYEDEGGRLLYDVLRFPNKQFRQRRPDGCGGWEWSTKGVRKVLYHLPDVVDAVRQGVPVYVVEGEKDADALARVGCVATCNPGGAGKWRPEYAEVLRGADVVIVADQDPAGTKHAADVEASLVGVARSVKVARPAIGKDAADHLAAGKTVEDFLSVDEPPTPSVDLVHFFITWPAFWAKDRRDADWLYEDVLARGRGHAIFASHKVGKSLLVLALAVQLVMRGIVVVYLDYEMGEDDLYDRLADMGHGPDSDLSRLHYALLPSLPPLDEPDGAKALFAKVDAVQAAWPDSHVAVVIDTTSRAVGGEENSADTYRNFYRWTGLGLKQRSVTWARLDHAGKDTTRGQRGSSAKGDDVDIVWRLVRTDNGLELRREASRMGWVPERVTFRQVDNPLRFSRVAEDWPAGTKEVATILDGLGVPLDSGERPAGHAFRSAGHTATQAVLRAALKWRRRAAESGFE